MRSIMCNHNHVGDEVMDSGEIGRKLILSRSCNYIRSRGKGRRHFPVPGRPLLAVRCRLGSPLGGEGEGEENRLEVIDTYIYGRR